MDEVAHAVSMDARFPTPWTEMISSQIPAPNFCVCWFCSSLGRRLFYAWQLVSPFGIFARLFAVRGHSIHPLSHWWPKPHVYLTHHAFLDDRESAHDDHDPARGLTVGVGRVGAGKVGESEPGPGYAACRPPVLNQTAFVIISHSWEIGGQTRRTSCRPERERWGGRGGMSACTD